MFSSTHVRLLYGRASHSSQSLPLAHPCREHRRQASCNGTGLRAVTGADL